jgi:hypothetical protein
MDTVVICVLIVAAASTIIIIISLLAVFRYCAAPYMHSERYLTTIGDETENIPMLGTAGSTRREDHAMNHHQTVNTDQGPAEE